jgi:hypothetical protein
MPRKPKRRMGPIPRGGGAATIQLSVRVTADERTSWSTAAAREGLSVSEWLRQAAELAIALAIAQGGAR